MSIASQAEQFLNEITAQLREIKEKNTNKAERLHQQAVACVTHAFSDQVRMSQAASLGIIYCSQVFKRHSDKREDILRQLSEQYKEQPEILAELITYTNEASGGNYEVAAALLMNSLLNHSLVEIVNGLLFLCVIEEDFTDVSGKDDMLNRMRGSSYITAIGPGVVMYRELAEYAADILSGKM